MGFDWHIKWSVGIRRSHGQYNNSNMTSLKGCQMSLSVFSSIIYLNPNLFTIIYHNFRHICSFTKWTIGQMKDPITKLKGHSAPEKWSFILCAYHKVFQPSKWKLRCHSTPVKWKLIYSLRDVLYIYIFFFLFGFKRIISFLVFLRSHQSIYFFWRA